MSRTFALSLLGLVAAAVVPTSSALACGMYIPPDLEEVRLADLLEEVDDVEDLTLSDAPKNVEEEAEKEPETESSTSALIRLLQGTPTATEQETVAPTTLAPQT